MPIVKAGPNEFLLTGRGGILENRGSAVRAILPPGTVYVLVPATKQQVAWEFTQETKDGIPLRFKGIIVYRVTDPVAAAQQFEFGSRRSAADPAAELLADVCRGELRDAVSHMTMSECIEQRKTTLTELASTVLRAATGTVDGRGGWGLTIEIAQVAQVFIVDAELRQQLEAEVRNDIRLHSDQSAVRTQEQTRLAEMASESRVQEERLTADKATLRRQEELDLAQLARQRRMQAEQLETERLKLQLDQQRLHAELETEQDRIASEAPVRRARIESERALVREEIELLELEGRRKRLDVEQELLLPRAQQAMRLELLPVEQAPAIVEAASSVLRNANLSVYGDGSELVGQLAPVLDVVTRAVHRVLPEAVPVQGDAPGA